MMLRSLFQRKGPCDSPTMEMSEGKNETSKNVTPDDASSNTDETAQDSSDSHLNETMQKNVDSDNCSIDQSNQSVSDVKCDVKMKNDKEQVAPSEMSNNTSMTNDNSIDPIKKVIGTPKDGSAVAVTKSSENRKGCNGSNNNKSSAVETAKSSKSTKRDTSLDTIWICVECREAECATHPDSPLLLCKFK